MKILLHDDIAAAGEAGILVADENGVDRGLTFRVLGAVDKTEQVALVEIAEAVHLVDRRHRAAEPLHDLRRQLEA